MTLTIKQLKEKIKDLPDCMEVYIERIEDVYFEKHGWNTIDCHYGMIDYHTVFNASQCAIHTNKLLILGHY